MRTAVRLSRGVTPHHEAHSTWPVVTFHNGHNCSQYRTHAGFQECAHGNVRRIGARRRTTRRESGTQPHMPAHQSESDFNRRLVPGALVAPTL